MIYDHGDEGVTVSKPYTDKAEVQATGGWNEIMKFILDNRPIVVYQFWIDLGKDGLPDTYKMLYSKIIPDPNRHAPSEV